MLAALVFAVVGVGVVPRRSRCCSASRAVTSIVLIVTVVGARRRSPDIRTEDAQAAHAAVALLRRGARCSASTSCSSAPTTSNYLLRARRHVRLGHPRGSTATRRRSRATTPRTRVRFPFQVLGTPPPHELIIGSAGGNEILASLTITRPTSKRSSSTRSRSRCSTNHFADYTGHLADRPDVHLHQGDGRSYLARHKTKYDLVWYVAPDSYAATNAASSGAFVLSESYLYTTRDDQDDAAAPHRRRDHGRAVRRARLPDAPNRTSRYVVTARKALQELGIKDPNNHLLVAAQLTQRPATSRRSS